MNATTLRRAWPWALLLFAMVAIVLFLVRQSREPAQPAAAASPRQVPWLLRGLLLAPPPDAKSVAAGQRLRRAASQKLRQPAPP